MARDPCFGPTHTFRTISTSPLRSTSPCDAPHPGQRGAHVECEESCRAVCPWRDRRPGGTALPSLLRACTGVQVGLFQAAPRRAVVGVATRLVEPCHPVAAGGAATAARLTFPRRGDYITAGSVAEHRFYLRCQMTPRSMYDEPPADFSVANVVYPLQYEPEASLLYFAPEIVSQVSYVETVLPGATLRSPAVDQGAPQPVWRTR